MMREGSVSLNEQPTLGADSDDAPDRDVHDYRRILDFERSWPGHRPMKERAIRAELHISTPRYYQLLSAIIDTPAALAYDPVLVNRLIRIRQTRANERAARFHLAPAL